MMKYLKKIYLAAISRSFSYYSQMEKLRDGRWQRCLLQSDYEDAQKGLITRSQATNPDSDW